MSLHNHIKTCSKWSELTQAEKDRMVANYYSHQELLCTEQAAEVDALFEDYSSSDSSTIPYEPYSLFETSPNQSQEVVDCDVFEYLTPEEVSQSLETIGDLPSMLEKTEDQWWEETKRAIYDHANRSDSSSSSYDPMEVEDENGTTIYLDDI